MQPSPDDLNGNEDDPANKTPQPNEKREGAPETKQEDVQMKKGLELFEREQSAASTENCLGFSDTSLPGRTSIMLARPLVFKGLFVLNPVSR